MVDGKYPRKSSFYGTPCPSRVIGSNGKFFNKVLALHQNHLLLFLKKPYPVSSNTGFTDLIQNKRKSHLIHPDNTVYSCEMFQCIVKQNKIHYVMVNIVLF